MQSNHPITVLLSLLFTLASLVYHKCIFGVLENLDFTFPISPVQILGGQHASEATVIY